MAAGDASRAWFSEMVETLRREWRPDTSGEEIIALRDRLDTMLQQIRLSRSIRPPPMWCPSASSGRSRLSQVYQFGPLYSCLAASSFSHKWTSSPTGHCDFYGFSGFQ